MIAYQDLLTGEPYQFPEHDCNYEPYYPDMRQETIFEINRYRAVDHRCFSYNRTLGSWFEKLIADLWEKENERDTLEQLLSEHRLPVTQYGASIAAEVIQWLGTNCGWQFILNIVRHSDLEARMKSHELYQDESIRVTDMVCTIKAYKAYADLCGRTIEECATSPIEADRTKATVAYQWYHTKYWPLP